MRQRGPVHIVREAALSDAGHLALAGSPGAGDEPQPTPAPAPLFLDEPLNPPPDRVETDRDSTLLFLDEDDPALSGEPCGHPPVEIAADAGSSGGPGESRPTRAAALILALALLVIAGAGAYRARGGTALAVWRSLGFD